MLPKKSTSYLLYIVIVGLVLNLQYCTDIPSEKLYIERGEIPIQINKDTVFYKDVIIGPGVIFEIYDSVTLTFKGDLILNGKKNSRIVFRPKNISWDFINIEGAGNFAEFKYVSIINGKVILGDNTSINISHTAFKNSAKQNHWDGLLVMKNGNSFYGDSITIVSNFEGEGIVLNQMDSVQIKNSSFTDVNDGFEILTCSYAVIENCIFNRTSIDDAIDLNGCKNVIIQNNSFNGIKDRCIEVGENHYYKEPSGNIVIVNNVFRNSRIGIESKESSQVYAGLNTFYRCKYAVEMDGLNSVLINYNSVVEQIDSSLVLTTENSEYVTWVHSVLLDVFSLGMENAKDIFPALVGLEKGVRGKQIRPVHFNIERVGELKQK